MSALSRVQIRCLERLAAGYNGPAPRPLVEQGYIEHVNGRALLTALGVKTVLEHGSRSSIVSARVSADTRQWLEERSENTGESISEVLNQGIEALRKCP